MSKGVSLLRTAQSLLTGRTIHTHARAQKRTRIASTCLSHDIFYASSCIFDDNMQLRNDIHQGIKGGDW